MPNNKGDFEIFSQMIKLKHLIPIAGAFLIGELDIRRFRNMCIYHATVCCVIVVAGMGEIFIHYS